MRAIILFGALMASCIVLSEATLILPALAVGKGALIGLALIKKAAFKVGFVGGLISRGGRRRNYRPRYHQNFGYNHRHHGFQNYRFKRSLDEYETILLSAAQNDASDCAKRLVCEVNGTPLENFSKEETMIARLFNPDHLDITKITVEFDLAAQIGKRVGIEQCAVLYERCPHDKKKLMEIFNDPTFGQDV
uniref:Uncharacterized protein n=2 Tax=Lepeophtheirus salmonis TaxID=72036 RepID=A0A0K2TSI0_LEPSM